MSDGEVDAAVRDEDDAELNELLAQAEAKSAEPVTKTEPQVTPEPKADEDDGEKPVEAKAKEKPAPASKDKPEAATQPEKAPKAESESEHNRAMAALRIKAEKAEAELRELRERAERAEREREAASKPTPQAVDPDLAFTMLAKARAGEYETTERDQAVRSAAENAIGNALNSQQIAAVLTKALSGGFGDKSAEVADLASKYLPVAQQKELRAVQERGEQEQAGRAAQAETQRQFSEVREKFAEFLKPDSPEGKFANEWDALHMGTGESALPESYQRVLHENPVLHAKAIQRDFLLRQSAIKAHEAEKAQWQQRESEYKKKLNLSASPETSSAPVAGRAANGDDAELEELIRRAEELSSAR